MWSICAPGRGQCRPDDMCEVRAMHDHGADLHIHVRDQLVVYATVPFEAHVGCVGRDDGIGSTRLPVPPAFATRTRLVLPTVRQASRLASGEYAGCWQFSVGDVTRTDRPPVAAIRKIAHLPDRLRA